MSFLYCNTAILPQVVYLWLNYVCSNASVQEKENPIKVNIRFPLFLVMHMFIKDCCPATNIHEKKNNNTANNYLTLLFWMTSFSNLKEKRRILGVHYNKWKQCTIISISVKKSKVSVYAETTKHNIWKK